MRRSRVVLPVQLQKEYTSLLYGALPLCVALANGFDGWYESRYANVFYRTAVNHHGETIHHLDFSDSYAYGQVLDLEYIPIDRAVALQSPLDLVRTSLNDGAYVIMFLDEGTLQGLDEIYSHELLYYGYDDVAQRFDTVGFSDEGRFGSMQLAYSPIDLAFRSLMRHPICENGRGGPMRAPIQILRPKYHTIRWDHTVLIEELESFVDSRVLALDEPCRWWWMTPVDTYPVLRQAFGLSAFEEIRHKLETMAPGEELDFSVVHFIYEHAVMLRNRLGLLNDRLLGGSASSLLPRLAGVTRTANVLRLNYLGMITRSLPFPNRFNDYIDLLNVLPSVEADAVEAVLRSVR